HDAAFLVQPDLELPVFARIEVRGEQGLAELGDGPTAQRDPTGQDSITGYRPQPGRIIDPLGAASGRGEGTVFREPRRPDELPVHDEPTVRYDRLSIGESLEDVQLSLQLAREPEVVRIQERQQIARGFAYAFIARGANATSRRHSQPLDRLAKSPLDDLCGPVGRAIVDNNDFEIPALLTQGAFHRLADQDCPVPCWDHDGKTTVAHATFLGGLVGTGLSSRHAIHCIETRL